MKLRLLPIVIFAGMILPAIRAHAQVGLYVNPIAIHVSNSVLDSGPFAFLGQNSTARTFWGVNLGGYYDFFHAANGLTAGIDLRDSDLHANNASLKDLMFGLRLSGKPFARPIKPYLQASVGIGSTKSPTSAISLKKIDYRIYGGLDYTLQRHIDFRVIEIGYGSLATISSATVGAGGNVAIPSSRLLSFSSGLVFRF